jgi:thiosulfate/3-mercaptopyruvate sulfurtransferase
MDRIFIKGIMTLFIFFLTSINAGELSSRMISTGWLRSNISKENIRIIDIRPVQKYYSNHIPHASYLNIESVRLSINGVPYLPIAPEALSLILGSLGIDDKSTVIVYGGQEDLQTYYLVWLLDYIGHKDVALLEGGYEKWERENRPLTQDLPEIEPVQYQMPQKMTDDIRANKKDVLKSIQNNSAVIIDVESPDTYAGIDGSCKRKGHIKGAINHYWKNDIESGYLWKSIDLLKRSYTQTRSLSNRKTILTCENGWAAALTYFTLRYIIGQNEVQLYDGGMGEWANSTDLPMETSAPEIQASSNDYR